MKKAICRSFFLKRPEILSLNHIRTHANLVQGPYQSNDVRTWKEYAVQLPKLTLFNFNTVCLPTSTAWFFFLYIPIYNHIYLSHWGRKNEELLFDKLTAFWGNGAVLPLTYFSHTALPPKLPPPQVFILLGEFFQNVTEKGSSHLA